LRFPRKIGHVLLATACGKAPEEEGVENHPAIAYACENADVQTFGTMTVISLRKILAELENLSELSGVHVSRLIQIRHKTTANIKFNLYGGGDRNEGRAALQARDSLDDFIFKAEQTDLVRGQIKETNVLKRAIILETFGELLEILDRGRELGGGTRKGIKAEIKKLMHDPDRLNRFNDNDKAAIREIASGLAIFAKSRFDRLHVALRRRARQFMR